MSQTDLNRLSTSTLKRFRSHSFLKDPLMVMPDVVYKSVGVVQKNERYIRLKTMVHYVSMEICYNLFHDTDYGGFPVNQFDLYRELKGRENVLAPLQGTIISDYEWHLLYPDNQQTSSQDFTVELFHVLIKYLVNSFPVLENDNNNNDSENYFTLLEKLKKTSVDCKDTVNSSDSELRKMWTFLCDIITRLYYDVRKVEELKTGDLDLLSEYRQSLLNVQLQLLSDECHEIQKSTSMNKLALGKLISDYNEVVSGEHTKPTSGDFSSKANLLYDDICLTSQMLQLVHQAVNEECEEVRFWREKNIEGDIIVFDEKIVKLKHQVNVQCRSVGEIFHTTSLDLVKIKERHQENSVHVLNQQKSASSHNLRTT